MSLYQHLQSVFFYLLLQSVMTKITTEIQAQATPTPTPTACATPRTRPRSEAWRQGVTVNVVINRNQFNQSEFNCMQAAFNN